MDFSSRSEALNFITFDSKDKNVSFPPRVFIHITNWGAICQEICTQNILVGITEVEYGNGTICIVSVHARGTQSGTLNKNLCACAHVI